MQEKLLWFLSAVLITVACFMLSKVWTEILTGIEKVSNAFPH